MKTGMSFNSYGTPVSVHVCEGCGEQFTVCPAIPDGVEWGGCQATTCVTYDYARDADRLFDQSPEHIECEPIRPETEH